MTLLHTRRGKAQITDDWNTPGFAQKRSDMMENVSTWELVIIALILTPFELVGLYLLSKCFRKRKNNDKNAN